MITRINNIKYGIQQQYKSIQIFDYGYIKTIFLFKKIEQFILIFVFVFQPEKLCKFFQLTQILTKQY